MLEPTSNDLAALTRLTEKVAAELHYAVPGKDDGLLPINALLLEMEAIAAPSTLGRRLEHAMDWSRRVVDAAFATLAFDSVQLQGLRDWVAWMQTALPLAQAGQA